MATPTLQEIKQQIEAVQASLSGMNRSVDWIDHNPNTLCNILLDLVKYLKKHETALIENNFIKGE